MFISVMQDIVDSECFSITLDTILILKSSKNTKNRYKIAENRNLKDTNKELKKQICYGNY